MNKDQPILDDKNSDDINVEICMTETTLIEPEIIDLEEEEDIDYRYFCLECEGCVGSSKCNHLNHPRVPLQFDFSSHIAKTGHVAIRPIGGFLSLSPFTDVAYSIKHGAEVRKQWKDLVLSGTYIPNQFSGVKRCKWANCKVEFEDAVEAFKHIRDSHLKSSQLVKSSSDVNNSGSNGERKSTADIYTSIESKL